MELSIEVITSAALPPETFREVRDLCTEAYEEEFTQYLRDIGPGVHVLGRVGGELVCHAMWVARALQPHGRAPLGTAYVEAVATKPAHQRRGHARRVLARVADEIRGWELGALSPSDEAFYAPLGWQAWRGPLYVRTDAGLQPTPDEGVMILRLPGTPADLDLHAPLSIEWRPGEVW